jgi:hypothetical protein
MAGWNGVLVARSVRELRSRTLKELTRPFDDTAGFTTRSDAEAAEKNDRTLNQILGNLSPRPLEQQVREASTRRELEVLWETHQDVWSDDLTRLAMARTAELGTTSDLPTAS